MKSFHSSTKCLLIILVAVTDFTISSLQKSLKISTNFPAQSTSPQPTWNFRLTQLFHPLSSFNFAHTLSKTTVKFICTPPHSIAKCDEDFVSYLILPIRIITQN